MEIRKVRYDEYETLMQVMNTSFDFVKDEDKFESILPKLYFKDNKKMVHIGAFDGEELCASIGLYEMKLIRKDKALKVGCIGAVSTLPKYRNKGLFSKLIQEVIKLAQEEKYELLFLGGDRFRYGNYGFECGGRALYFNLSKRNLVAIKGRELSLSKLEKDDSFEIKECLKLYNSTKEHMERNEDNFFDHLVTWCSRPYVLKDENKVVGYVSFNRDDRIIEFVYQENYLDSMLRTLVNHFDEVEIECDYGYLSEELLSKVNYYKVENTEMYKILDYQKVYEYLGIEKEVDDEFEKLDDRLKVRLLFGDQIKEPKYNNKSLYIGACDQG